MRDLRKHALTIACMAAIALALAQDGGSGAAQEAYDELEQVLIIGERTPPLWKLSKKGHVLWILGTYRPQPRNFQLNSKRLDSLIAGSDEVIFPGAAYVASIAISALTEVVNSDRNPGGATLQQLMPADGYAKWLALRQRYATAGGLGQAGPKFAWSGTGGKWVVLTEPYRGGDGIDSMRPTFAWEAVRRVAMDRHGLASYDIEAGVSSIAKRHNVPVRKLRFGREFIWVLTTDPILEDFHSKKFNAAEVLGKTDYGDLGCLAANVDLLEPVIEMLQVRANAWARGDLATFRTADKGQRLRDCVTELVAAVSGARLPGSIDAKKAQDRYYSANRDSNSKVQKGWLREVQDAVKKNKVTFAVLPLDQLLAEKGYLPALRDKGFTVEQSGQLDPE